MPHLRKLIEDEKSAVEEYSDYLVGAPPKEAKVLKHIREDEKEHERELKSLENTMEDEKKVIRTEIEHHDDGSHTVRHHGKDGKVKSYAVSDLDGIHDGLEEHLGCENCGEEEAEKGEHGMEEEEGNPYGESD